MGRRIRMIRSTFLAHTLGSNILFSLSVELKLLCEFLRPFVAPSNMVFGAALRRFT